MLLAPLYTVQEKRRIKPAVPVAFLCVEYWMYTETQVRKQSFRDSRNEAFMA